MKKYLQNRLAKIRQILLREDQQPDQQDAKHEVYVTENDEKHPDTWEKIDGWPYIKWVRHHEKPRQDFFIPSGGPSGPDLESLLKTRKTYIHYPDGRTELVTDEWRDPNSSRQSAEYRPLW